MTRAELIALLERLSESNDAEVAHVRADAALLDYINDPLIRDAYDQIYKWYA